MKKIVLALSLIIAVLSICFLVQHNRNQTPPSEEYFLTESLRNNSQLYAINHPIEEKYILLEQTTGGATVEIAGLFEEIAEDWIQETEKYYELIRDVLSDAERVDFENYFATLKEQDQVRSAYYTNYVLGAVHGTNASILLARNYMCLNRELALRLIEYYDFLMVGRGWSWGNYNKDSGVDYVPQERLS